LQFPHKYEAEHMDLNQSYSPLIAPSLSSLVAKIKSRTSFRQIISGVVCNAQKESSQTHACIFNTRVRSSYLPCDTWNLRLFPQRQLPGIFRLLQNSVCLWVCYMQKFNYICASNFPFRLR